MGGRPDWFQVTNLEILDTGALSGSGMKDVIALGAAPLAERRFDLLVTFEASDTHLNWFGLAEGFGGESAGAEFFAESIGPGPEISLGTNNVNLVPGGNPGGSPIANTSLYQVRLPIADADTVFLDDLANPAPGLYRIGCAVSVFVAAGGNYADAYYQQDLVVRVMQK